jgi:sucrose-6-phosphate hydrolase SacC (GH32 family)
MGNRAYNEQLPTVGWKGQQTMPRELALRTVAGRPVLVQQPAGQLASSAASSPDELPPLRVSDGQQDLPTRARAFDLSIVLRPGTAHRFGVDVRAGADQQTRIRHDRLTEQLFVDRCSSGAPVAVTVQTYPDANSDGIRLFADGGDVTLVCARLTGLGADPQ